MIEINLLPEELKKRKRAAPKVDIKNVDLNKLPLVSIGITAVIVIIGVQVVVFGFGIIGNMIFRSLDANYSKVLPAKKEAEQLRSDISKMSKKVAAIDELMVKRFSWAKKLNDLSDSISPGIWLTQLEYDEKIVERAKSVPASVLKSGQGEPAKAPTEKILEKYLIISGAASNSGEEGTALVGRFIKNLKENPSFYSDFNDIELGSIKREQMSGQEMMTFKITCLFKVK